MVHLLQKALEFLHHRRAIGSVAEAFAVRVLSCAALSGSRLYELSPVPVRQGVTPCIVEVIRALGVHSAIDPEVVMHEREDAAVSPLGCAQILIDVVRWHVGVVSVAAQALARKFVGRANSAPLAGLWVHRPQIIAVTDIGVSKGTIV